jgi:hypothetical protein
MLLILCSACCFASRRFRHDRRVLNPILNLTPSARALHHFLRARSQHRFTVLYDMDIRAGPDGSWTGGYRPVSVTLSTHRSQRSLTANGTTATAISKGMSGISGITILHLDFPRAVGNRNRTPSLRPPPRRIRSAHRLHRSPSRPSGRQCAQRHAPQSHAWLAQRACPMRAVPAGFELSAPEYRAYAVQTL